MAMGIVSDEEFNREAGLLINEQTAEIIDINKGRGNGNKQVPESLRKIIGETNELDSRPEALAIARQFGISSSSVSAYGNGSHSTASYDSPDEGLKGHIEDAKERIAKKARGRLFNALKHITDEKLADAKVKDVSGVARDMAAIIKDLEPESAKESGVKSPQFIFYAPTFRKEETFETIHIKE